MGKLRIIEVLPFCRQLLSFYPQPIKGSLTCRTSPRLYQKPINAISESITIIAAEMARLATLLPEYPIVSAFYGVGDILCPQIMAEIGDIYRFKHKGSLVCFAGLEAPPYQSGKFESSNRSISKKGSPHLRRSLFLVMSCLIRQAPQDDPVYQFLDRKRAEGKHYYSYMTAGSAKFLRVYYGRVKEHLDKLHRNQ